MCRYRNVRLQFSYILRFENFIKSLLLVTPWAIFSAWNKFAIVNTIIQSVVSFYWDCHTIVDYTQRTLTHFKENRCRKCLHKGKIIGVCLFINWEPPATMFCWQNDFNDPAFAIILSTAWRYTPSKFLGINIKSC